MKKNIQKYICPPINWLIIFALVVHLACPSVVFSQTVQQLPAPGTMVNSSNNFSPVMIKGLLLQPENPLRLDFIIDAGEVPMEDRPFEAESMKLINYFLASLTMPEEDMWVNLSPYEQNRIIPENFMYTEMGRDLLVQDYLLKQLTASLLHPDEELGGKFWERVHTKAQASYGRSDIPLDTFNKVWIVPDQAVVYEHENKVFVLKSHMKVLLEEDYEAFVQSGRNILNNDERMITNEIMRDIVIPEIEREVNSGKNFTQLRQIYNALILATWYKKNLKQSLLGQVYVNQKKVGGITHDDQDAKLRIYNQYIQAFKKGVYNFIKEEFDPYEDAVIPRHYFSGGINQKSISQRLSSADTAMSAADIEQFLKNSRIAHVELGQINVSSTNINFDDQLASISFPEIDTAMLANLSDQDYSDLTDAFLEVWDIYYSSFKRHTAQATSYFETDNVDGFKQSDFERKEIYHVSRDRILKQIRELFKANPDDIANEEFWNRLRAEYKERVSNMNDGDIATIFFDSVQRLLWLSYGKSVDRGKDFLVTSTEKTGTISRVYPLPEEKSLGELSADTYLKGIFSRIVADSHLEVSYPNLDSDLELLSDMVVDQLRTIGVDAPLKSVHILIPEFIRHQGAYLVGKLEFSNGEVVPLVIALNRQDNKTVIDAVMVGVEDTYGLIRSTTRSPFHVYTEHYREIQSFVQEVFPEVESYEIYNALGYPALHKALTNAKVQDVLDSADYQIEFINETADVVTFGISGLPYVFETIRGDAPDTEVVKKRFLRGHDRDRMGQLLDHWVYRAKTFSKHHFSKELLGILAERGGSDITIVDDDVYFERIYVRRRITRVSDYINDESKTDKKEILLKVGRTIKNLASMGIFPLDMNLSHFGVTSWGQVVYTNTAGIGMAEMRTFGAVRDRMILEATAAKDDTSAHLIVYPETFEEQLQIPARYRDVFNTLHGDIFTADFWNMAKLSMKDEKPIDIYPYRRQHRLKVWQLKKAIFDQIFGTGQANSIGKMFGERQVSRVVDQIMNVIVDGEPLTQSLDMLNDRDDSVEISFSIRENALRIYMYYDNLGDVTQEGRHEKRGRAWLSMYDIPIDQFSDIMIPTGTGNTFGRNALFMLLLGENGIREVAGNKGAGFNDFLATGMKFPPGMTLSVDFVENITEENIDSLMSDIITVLHQYMWYYIDQDGRDEFYKFKYSVRSSGVVSRPGMLNTEKDVETRQEIRDAILKNVKVAKELAKKEGVDHIPFAIIIQEMRYGTAGVIDTVNPSTGEAGIVGRILDGATGDELMTGGKLGRDFNDLRSERPEVYNKIVEDVTRLVSERKDDYPQQLEFVIEEDGTVFYLQTRDTKFSPQGEVNFLKRQVKEGLMTEANTLPRIDELQRRLAGRKLYKLKSGIRVDTLAEGAASSSGAMRGHLTTSAEEAKRLAAQDQPVIALITLENRTEMLGFVLSQEAKEAGVGVITNFGNESDHEAVITRNNGIPAIINILDAHLVEGGIAITRQGSDEQIIRWGDDVVIDATGNSVFLPLGRKSILVLDKVVEYVSFAIDYFEYRKEISAPYLTEAGMKLLDHFQTPAKFPVTSGIFHSDYDYKSLLDLRIKSGVEFRRISKGDDAKETLRANLRQHFLHDLVLVAARADGVEPWELNTDIEILDLIEMLKEQNNPRTDWRNYNEILEILSKRADLRAVRPIFKRWVSGTPSVRKKAKSVLENYDNFGVLRILYSIKNEEGTLPEGFDEVVTAQLEKYLQDLILRLSNKSILDLTESERTARLIFTEEGITRDKQIRLTEYLQEKLPNLYDAFPDFSEDGIEFKVNGDRRMHIKRLQNGEYSIGYDQAQLGAKEDEFGGINFNPNLIQLDIQGDKNSAPNELQNKIYDPGISMEMEEGFNGFQPIIINISPANIPLLMGEMKTDHFKQVSAY